MVKLKGIKKRKKHSEKKKQHRYGNRQPQFVLRYDQVLPLLLILRSLNLHDHKKNSFRSHSKELVSDGFHTLFSL